MQELNMNEMELVDGGVYRAIAVAFLEGAVAGAAAAATRYFLQ